MRLRKNLLARAFTLVEVMVVVAIISIAAVAIVSTGFTTIGRSTAQTERDVVVSLLMTARTRAQSNMNQASHGVHIGSTAYTLFQGTSYVAGDTNNRDYPRETGISLSGATDVLFSQLTGDVGIPGSVTVSVGGGSASVTVSSNGRIDW